MENNSQSNLLRGHVDTIILNALFEGDKYGYEICKEITEKAEGQFELKQPTLYSCLKRLENQGLIQSYWGTTVTHGGRRKYYRLSDTGKDICQKNLSQWEYQRTLFNKLYSDKPYDLSSPAPEVTDIKITGVHKSKRKDLDVLQESNSDAENNESNEIAAECANEDADFAVETRDDEERLIVQPRPYQPETSGAGTQSYSAMISESGRKAREFLFDTPAEVPVLKAPENDLPVEQPSEAVQEERKIPKFRLEDGDTETPAEKSYKSLLGRLLNLTKTHTANETALYHPFGEQDSTTNSTAQKQSAEPMEQRTDSQHEDAAESVAEEYVVPEYVSQPIAEMKDTIIAATAEKIVVETACDYNISPAHQQSGLDFSSLQAKMSTEGIKIRTHSTHTPYMQAGMLLINKLLFCTMSIILSFAAVELILFYFLANSFLKLPASVYITLGIVIGVMFFTCFILYAIHPQKRAKDKFQFLVAFGLASILTILTFIASFAIALISLAQLHITTELFRTVILPTIMALNMPIGVIIYALLKRKSSFLIQQ